MNPSLIERYVPQAWAEPIVASTGILAFLGVLMLLLHMNREWSHLYGRDQRMRYLTFLAYGVLQAGATTEQLSEASFHLGWRHVAALGVAIMFFATCAVSLWWSFHNNFHPPKDPPKGESRDQTSV